MKKNNYLEILDLCNTKGTISVDELVEALDLSPSTVRREIVKLEKDGLVDRYHGGIKSNYSSLLSVPFEQRKFLYKEEKSRIAKYAASLIEDNSFILIDSGTTCSLIADYLTAKNVIVVTNGIEMIKPLIDKGCSVSIPPGNIVQNTSLYIDFIQNLEYLDNFKFDSVFMGTNSINPKTHFASQSASHSAILKKMVSRSDKVYILADDSKFGTVSRYSFANFNQATVITNKEPDLDDYPDLNYVVVD